MCSRRASNAGAGHELRYVSESGKQIDDDLGARGVDHRHDAPDRLLAVLVRALGVDVRAPLMPPSFPAAVMWLLQPGPLSVTSSGVAGASLMVVDSVRTGDIVVPGLALFPASPDGGTIGVSRTR